MSYNTLQLTAAIPQNNTAFAPLESCSTPRLITPTTQPTIAQGFPHINGRYVVWFEIDNLTSVDPLRVIGYDLGPDYRFSTVDDIGLVNLTNFSIHVGFLSGAGNSNYPRVNKNGLVAFIKGILLNQTTGHYEVQLVTCDFNSCQNTTNIIDSFSSSYYGPFPMQNGQFVWHDINDDLLAVSKSDFVAGTTSIVLYNLTSGIQQIIAQGPAPTFLNYIAFFDLYVDDNSLVSWQKVYSSLNIAYDIFINLPNTVNPILINSQQPLLTSGLPLFGIVESSSAYKFGQKVIVPYSVPDSNNLYLDLKYRTYTNNVSSQMQITNNDNMHQLYPRLTFHSGLNNLFLVFTSLNLGSSFLKTMVYHNISNSFVDYGKIDPPSGWYGMYESEISNFNIVSLARSQGTIPTLWRNVITECL